MSKPRYSEETYRRWDEQENRTCENLRKHTHESEEVCKINDLYVVFKQQKYDECLRRVHPTDKFIVQVWEDETRQDPNKCLVHNIYTSLEEGRKSFEFWKTQCE